MTNGFIKKVFKYIAIVAFFAIIAVCGWLGRTIPYSDQYILLDGLRQTASIMFGIFGAWLALVYRRELSHLLVGKKESDVKNEIQEVDDSYDDFVHVYKGVTFSSLIVAIVLGIGYVAPIVRKMVCCPKIIPVIRGISFSVIGFLTVAQIFVIWLSLSPMVTAFLNMHKANRHSDFLKKR